MFTIQFNVFIVHLTRTLGVFCVRALSLSSLGSCFLKQVMESISSSAYTVPSLLLFEQVCGIFASFIDEIDLSKIALSCRYALGLLWYKEGAYYSA